MIPYLRLQSLSPWSTQQEEVEIDPIKNAKALETQAVFPATQVSNTTEQPTTLVTRKISHDERLKRALFQMTSQCQREALTFLIKIMLGLENFEYDESKIEWMHKLKDEKYCIRTLLGTAFQAETALFHFKTFVATLIELKNKTKVEKEIRSTQRSMKFALKSFIAIGIEYHCILDKLSKQSKSEFIIGLTDSQISYAVSRMTTAKKTRDEARDKYRSKFIETGLNEAKITEKLSAFVRKHLVKSILKEISSRELINFVQNYFDNLGLPQMSEQETVVVNLEEEPPTSTPSLTPRSTPELPSIFSSSPVLTSLLAPTSATLVIVNSSFNDVDIASIFEELEFKEERVYVDKNFWESFEISLTQSEYLAKFHQFLLTNWMHERCYNQELKQDLIKARMNEKTIEEYNILLKSYFQKNIQLNAVAFIKHVLRVKEYQARIINTSKIKNSERERINYKNVQELSLNYLKNIICKNIYEVYSSYKIEKYNASMLSEIELKEKIIKLFKKRDNVRKGTSHEQKQLNLSSSYNLQYINQVLHLIREKSDFDESKVVKLAKFFWAKEEMQQIDIKNTQSSSTQISHFQNRNLYDPTQIGSEPPAKRMAIMSTVTNETFSSMLVPRLHFSQPDVVSQDIVLTSNQELAHTSLSPTDQREKVSSLNQQITEENIVEEGDRDLLFFMEQKFPQIDMPLFNSFPLLTTSPEETESTNQMSMLNFASTTQASKKDIAASALPNEREGRDFENRQDVSLLEGMDDIIAEYWEKKEK